MQSMSLTRTELPLRLHKTVKTAKAAAVAVSVSGRISDGVDAVDAESETALFAAMHTCAYRANQASRGARENGRAADLWRVRWKTIRDYLIERNLGLVYSTAVRSWRGQSEWEESRSAALLAMIRAAEGFDPWRGIKFSTYACTAIRRALICVARTTQTYRFRFHTNQEVPNEPADRRDNWRELFVDRLQRALAENTCDLTKREMTVLKWRFPASDLKARTLAEIGRSVGVSKERVRQIQKSALEKLRAALAADPHLQ